MQTKSLLVVLASAFLYGCATGVQTEEAMKTWIGGSVDSLIQSWGPPQSSVNLSNGQQMHTWRHTSSYTAPVSSTTSIYGGPYIATAYTDTYGGQTYNFWCERSFTVNKHGTITRWSWRGNNCP